MEVKSLCIDLMPDRQIHGQTDRQIHRQTGRHKVGNQEANRTYRVSIRIIRENKVLQERGKAKFENEKNKSIAFLHKTFTRKLNFSYHCFSDAIFLCFSIILYLWIGIIPLFVILQFTLLFMSPSFPTQTRNRRIYFLDTSLKVRNRK